MEKMQFTLFSEISFEVSDPIALIESFCFQSDFYKNYDLLLQEKENRTIENVNKIGARIKEEILEDCKVAIDESKDLKIIAHNLDSFLTLKKEEKEEQIKEVSKVIQKLLEIDKIGLSKATKILHTHYPDIIPIIDGQLQKAYKKYRKEIKQPWEADQAEEILLDFYMNFEAGDTWKNLCKIAADLKKSNLNITKVRIFDILWWSYLKAETLRSEIGIKWDTIRTLPQS